MPEKCEFCGKFGAQRHTYTFPSHWYGKPTITLYLCPECDKIEREYENSVMEQKPPKSD